MTKKEKAICNKIERRLNISSDLLKITASFVFMGIIYVAKHIETVGLETIPFFVACFILLIIAGIILPHIPDTLEKETEDINLNKNNILVIR
jgi:hypothetical protein